MCIYNQLSESQYFSDQMESISKSRLFPLLCSQSLHRFEVEIVIQVQIIQVFPVYEQVEHVVALLDHLEAGFYPVDLSQLEELGFCESLEERSLVLRLGLFVVELVQNPDF